MPKQIDMEPLLPEIERLAGEGLTDEQIALSLGFSAKTFYRNKKRSETFREAVKRGRASSLQELSNILFTAAREGNMSAAMFLAKAVHGWRDSGEMPKSQKDKPLPGKVILEVKDSRKKGGNNNEENTPE